MDDVRTVVSSLYSTFVIKNNGELWGWGNVECMPDPYDEPVSTPVKLMENVKQVISGGDSMFVIKDNNELWGWGANAVGDLGDGTRNMSYKPKKIMDDVREVISGNIAEMAIKNNGELWGWGLERYFDESDSEEIIPPRKILENVKHVNIDGTPYIINENGELWSWDSSGLKKIRDDILLVENGIVTLALDENNELLVWGNGKLVPEKLK